MLLLTLPSPFYSVQSTSPWDGTTLYLWRTGPFLLSWASPETPLEAQPWVCLLGDSKPSKLTLKINYHIFFDLPSCFKFNQSLLLPGVEQIKVTAHTEIHWDILWTSVESLYCPGNALRTTSHVVDTMPCMRPAFALFIRDLGYP